jgi:hypothetical protein
MNAYTRWIKEKVIMSLAVFAVLLLGVGSTQAAPSTFPTGNVDFGPLAATAASVTSASLVKWRTGTAGQSPTAATSLTFQYLQSGTNLTVPNRTSVKDNSANNQGFLWSDNAIQVSYVKPNNTASAILIHTSNASGGATDPLSQVQLRGGLVGGAGGTATDPNRASVLPLVWKDAGLGDLQAVSNANVNGTAAIPATSILFMPSYVPSSAGGACVAEGPYGASTRANNGFCDYSTHFFSDPNNTDPKNLWYTGYDPGTQLAQRSGTFNYASLVNAFGDSAQEQGGFGPGNNPMFAVLGVNATNALQTQYSAVITVEALNF